MKYSLKIQLYFIFLFAAAIMIIGGCEQQLASPSSMRFTASVFVADTTSKDSLLGVANADVVLQSITYGRRYEAETDANGTAYFHDLLPDRYNVMATGKLVDLTEMLIVNGQLQDTMLYIENNDTLPLAIVPELSRTSALVISEVYYSGAPPNPVPQYFHDQFLEIYNNSTETLYLDSIIVADAYYGFADDSLIHSVHAYMFPGAGEDYPIAPGEFIVVAQDAVDHSQRPIYSVNLLNADFEYYLSDEGDVNNPDAVNMIQIHHKYGVDFLYSVFNDGLVLLKTPDPYAFGYDEHNRLMLPVSDIIDGMEYRENLSETSMKRFSPAVDGGITGGIPSYSLKSVERRIEYIEDGQIIFMDNNNSSLDFIVLEFPTPAACGSEVAE